MSSRIFSPVFGIGSALSGFALYATHDALTKHLGVTYSVFQIIFFAMLFAFVPMAIMMLVDKSEKNFRPRHPWLVMIRTASSLVALSCGFYSFTVLPLAEVYSLLFAAPLLITIFAIPILGEVVRIQRWAAVIVGMIGVMIVLRPGVSELSFGHMTALTSACANALGSVIVRKVGAEERSAVLIIYPMILAMVVMGALLPGVYVPLQLPDMGMMAAIGLLSVVAQLCVITGYRSAPAGVIAPMQYSQILWAALFGYLFFQETPDIYVGLGSGLIIASGLFLVWRESRTAVSNRNPVSRTFLTRFALASNVMRKSERSSE
ncbi:DMT family transporter [Roseibium limicola]|uniref:DMT family transporter n=1 Tax=Roseibium limicola TaxID=2816037 RepID=A0A939ES73_9HYPH|nr:DMT family transporter [Roseibium limicola]MBO0347518.1 DMT family transporter [Roseibium limicola]